MAEVSIYFLSCCLSASGSLVDNCAGMAVGDAISADWYGRRGWEEVGRCNWIVCSGNSASLIVSAKFRACEPVVEQPDN
jgi:hypothetical protein